MLGSMLRRWAVTLTWCLLPLPALQATAYVGVDMLADGNKVGLVIEMGERG